MKLMAVIVAIAMIGSLAAVVSADDVKNVEVIEGKITFGFYADDPETMIISAPAGGVGAAAGVPSWGFTDLSITGSGVEAFNPAGPRGKGLDWAAGPGTMVSAGNYQGGVAFPAAFAEGDALGLVEVDGFGVFTIKGNFTIDKGTDSEGNPVSELIELNLQITNIFEEEEEECECDICAICDGCLIDGCDCEECPGACTCPEIIEEDCSCKFCKKCGGCLVDDCDCGCDDCEECECLVNPPAGVALAIIPTIVAAGAAIVASRKRK